MTTTDTVAMRPPLFPDDLPAGRLPMTGGAGPGRDGQRDVPVTGWLGLLRALYLVTGSS